MPAYPSNGFADLAGARDWSRRFIDWYNSEHRHSQIGFVTPNQRHSGQSTQILQRRREVYQRARQARPNRWSGKIRRWTEPDHVWLNKRDKEAVAA